MINIQLGLLKIPIMPINFINNRYAISGLKTFSKCCGKAVKHKKVCGECDKKLLGIDILKGTDEETILTDEQQQELKECLENGLIEVVGIRNKKEDDLFNLIPFIQKSQLILPNISKGYRKTDIKTYFSFINAMKELNRICLVKFVNRGLEHLGVLVIYKDDLIFIEIPFKKYYNDDIKRLKEAVNNVIALDNITDLNKFQEQAKEFINTFKSKDKHLNKIEEEKSKILNVFIEQIKSGNLEKPKKKKQLKEIEVNPFKN